MSILGTVVQGVLADYLGKPFTKSKMEEATARIVKSFLMTREGANLPAEGKATNFSDKEVSGENKQEEKPKLKFKGIVSTPGMGTGDDPNDTAPVAYYEKD